MKKKKKRKSSGRKKENRHLMDSLKSDVLRLNSFKVEDCNEHLSVSLLEEEEEEKEDVNGGARV